MILLHSRYLLFHKSVITLRERLMGFVFFGYPSIVAGLFSSAIILTFFKIKLQSFFFFLVFVFMCRKVKKCWSVLQRIVISRSLTILNDVPLLFSL